ncbi:MAG: hypothetical protein NXH75_04760 [Halobacteriovoraceae bacterium]|nr:hypothetical protein [Halobacteriovoraceae bacterium]
MIKWKVGKYGKDIVSRGFRLTFEIPDLAESEWQSIYENNEANGWVIRLRKKHSTRNEIMGFMAMEMVSIKPGTEKSFRFSKSRKGSVGVYYAASAISSRLDSLPCPALNHRLIIDDSSVVDDNRRENLWVTSAVDKKYMSARIQMISYSPITINGGMSLKGNYYIDLALYNTKSKYRVSSWVPVANYVSIEKEDEVGVKGCENYIVPNQGSGDPVKKFKFGR